MKFDKIKPKEFSIENLNKDQKKFLEKLSTNNIVIDNNLKKELTSFVGSFFNMRYLEKSIKPLMDGISKNLENENINKHGYKHVLDVAKTASLSYLSFNQNHSIDKKIRNILKIFISGIFHDIGYINGLIESGDLLPLSKGEKYGNHAIASGHIFRGVVEDKIEKFNNKKEKKDILSLIIKKKFLDFFGQKDVEELLKDGKKMILNHDSPDKLTEGIVEILSKDINDMHLYIGDKILCNVNRQPDNIKTEDLLNRELTTFAHKRIALAIQGESLEIKEDEKKVIYTVEINPEEVNNKVYKESVDKDIFNKYKKYSKDDFIEDFTVFKKRFIYLSLIFGKAFNHNFSSGAFKGFEIKINLIKKENGKKIVTESQTESISYESKFEKNLKKIISGINHCDGNNNENNEKIFSKISDDTKNLMSKILEKKIEDIEIFNLIKDENVKNFISEVYNEIKNIYTRQDIENKIEKSGSGSDIYHNLMLNKDFKEKFNEKINLLEEDDKNSLILKIFNL